MPLPRLAFGLALSLATFAAAAAKSHPSTPPLRPEELTVDGTAFVYRAPDGSELRGADLAHRVVEMRNEEDRAILVRIESVKPDKEDPEILRHEFVVQNEKGKWKPYCAPNFYGETWGIPVGLPDGHPGRLGPITVACSSGAIVKCIRYGYKPWAKGPQGDDLAPYHAACMRMIRADYCGKGEAHTKDGTMVQVYDLAGVRPPMEAPDKDHVFEAAWGPGGATCAARTRRDDVLKIDELHARCPSLPLGDACTEASGRDAGALVFDRVRSAP